jgi:hypothetical protein
MTLSYDCALLSCAANRDYEASRDLHRLMIQPDLAGDDVIRVGDGEIDLV